MGGSGIVSVAEGVAELDVEDAVVDVSCDDEMPVVSDAVVVVISVLLSRDRLKSVVEKVSDVRDVSVLPLEAAVLGEVLVWLSTGPAEDDEDGSRAGVLELKCDERDEDDSA